MPSCVRLQPLPACASANSKHEKKAPGQKKSQANRGPIGPQESSTSALIAVDRRKQLMLLGVGSLVCNTDWFNCSRGRFQRVAAVAAPAAVVEDVNCQVEVQPPLEEGLDAVLKVRLTRGELGAPVLWDDLLAFAMPGAKKHRMHIHVYDSDDPDIPGIEIGHIHPEEFVNEPGASPGGKSGVYEMEFAFEHPGNYGVEISYMPQGTSTPVKELRQFTIAYPM